MLNKRAVLALLALCGAAPARAMDPDIMSVIGQPVLALAQRPEVGVVLRPASGGHRSAIADALREAGPPVGVVDGQYLHGYGCNHEGCRVRGIFLAWDLKGERMFMLLTEEGRVRLSIPPDPRAWPRELSAPLAGFSPALSEAIGKR
ncbi:MAG: hypothetical protein ACR2IG_11305 [Roseomonas sp.]